MIVEELRALIGERTRFHASDPADPGFIAVVIRVGDDGAVALDVGDPSGRPLIVPLWAFHRCSPVCDWFAAPPLEVPCPLPVTHSCDEVGPVRHYCEAHAVPGCCSALGAPA